jgi:hypothetical protein
MALLTVVCGCVVAPNLPVHPSIQPDIIVGLSTLADPWLLLMIEAIWLGVFFYFGRSMVTGASLSFHVNHERV